MDLPDSGIELGSPALQADSLPTEVSGKPLIVLSLILYSELAFYIMALVEYLAVNTDDELIYFRSPFTFIFQIIKCHQSHSLETAFSQEALLLKVPRD